MLEDTPHAAHQRGLLLRPTVVERLEIASHGAACPHRRQGILKRRYGRRALRLRFRSDLALGI